MATDLGLRKIFRSGEGKGIRGEKGEKTGVRKLKVEKGKEKKGGGGKKTMETEPLSRISILNLLLNSPMPYPSPTACDSPASL